MGQDMADGVDMWAGWGGPLLSLFIQTFNNDVLMRRLVGLQEDRELYLPDLWRGGARADMKEMEEMHVSFPSPMAAGNSTFPKEGE